MHGFGGSYRSVLPVSFLPALSKLSQASFNPDEG